MKKKLIIRLKGGLGNQLFSYAYAKKIAVENNLELYIDNYTGFTSADIYKREYCLDYFTITATKIKNPFKNINNKFIKRALCLVVKYYFLLTYYYIKDKDIEHINHKYNYYIEGYWQSSKYVNSIKKIIEDEYCINTKDLVNNKYYKMIKESQNAVGVHVRIGDNKDQESINNLVNYYKNAFDKMNEMSNNNIYFIFTDNMDYAKEIIGGNHIYIINQGNDINDFKLYISCRHFIIAASTFSWWGAWLGKHNCKTVLCPSVNRFKNSFWNQPDLIDKSWIAV